MKIILEIVNWNAFSSQANNIDVNRDQEGGSYKKWSRLKVRCSCLSCCQAQHLSSYGAFKIQSELNEKYTYKIHWGWFVTTKGLYIEFELEQLHALRKFSAMTVKVLKPGIVSSNGEKQDKKRIFQNCTWNHVWPCSPPPINSQVWGD